MSIRVKILVRPTGDDEAGDGTPDAPFKTTARALRVPPTVDECGTVRYVIDNTGCAETTPVTMPAYQSRQKLYYASDEADVSAFGIEGYVTIQAVPTVLDTLSSGTTAWAFDAMSNLAKVADSSKAWAADAHKGKFLLGSGAFEVAAIAGNTATELTTDAYFEFTPPLIIVETAASMDAGLNMSGVVAPVAINGQRMVMPGDNDRSLNAFSCASVFATMCDIHNFYIAQCGVVSINGYIHGAGGNVTGCVTWAQLAYLSGFFENCVMDSAACGNYNPSGIYKNCRNVLGSSAFGSAAPGQVLLAEFWGLPLHYPGGGGVSVEFVTVRNVTGDGLVFDGPGPVDLFDHVGVDAATVTGGMFIDNGAQVKIDDPATITPTGSSSAQLKVGSLAATTWALFYATPNECDASRGAARAFV